VYYLSVIFFSFFFFIYYHSPIFQENLPLHDLLCWPEEIKMGVVSFICLEMWDW